MTAAFRYYYRSKFNSASRAIHARGFGIQMRWQLEPTYELYYGPCRVSLT